MANATVHKLADYRDSCKHDMPRLLCSWCKPKPKRSIWDKTGDSSFEIPSIRPPTTRANFDSSCMGCGGDISVGDLLGLRHDEWICEDCAGEEDDMERAKNNHPSTPMWDHSHPERATKAFTYLPPNEGA
jgi:hypothetical protein